MANPLENLDYFVEWGGSGWTSLLAQAFDQFISPKLEGQHVLEIGSRYGKMVALFALLGAKVTGVDINADCLPIAQAEVKKWNVSEGTDFVLYDGNLDVFADEVFDLVFTKSVLTMVPRLADFVPKIAAKLKPGGKIVFLENGRGNWLLHSLRALRHRRWDYRHATYFTRKEIDLIGSVFEVNDVKYHRLPPVYLILGRRRGERLAW